VQRGSYAMKPRLGAIPQPAARKPLACYYDDKRK